MFRVLPTFLVFILGLHDVSVSSRHGLYTLICFRYKIIHKESNSSKQKVDIISQGLEGEELLNGRRVRLAKWKSFRDLLQTVYIKLTLLYYKWLKMVNFIVFDHNKWL